MYIHAHVHTCTHTTYTHISHTLTCTHMHTQLKDSLNHLSNLMETVASISPPLDIAHFAGGQNTQIKSYPPPSADHKTPELPLPKTPEATPVNLVRSGGGVK